MAISMSSNSKALSSKKEVCKEIKWFFIKEGITWLDANSFQKKIKHLNSKWQSTDKWQNQTGVGVWQTVMECKAEANWNDDDPQWECVKDIALAPILKWCKYYFELELVFSPHHGNTRLAPTNSASKLVKDALASSAPSQFQDPLFDSLPTSLAQLDDSESLHDPDEHLLIPTT
ncbi:hypothetical protein CROQUDRAFT_101770 [Cronartium quercuum f. sp. fusiforme G11]|uniref:Uncharacterized protein n=1 Tax=Cronartium quercuum f. sp. fusiforme G11 TaxID=708437 RepID=A0A9P6N5N3_9BASI|nr:hypothetical protein CROQUDRAFT_101770 [Cronartium quercuum f. sp. fusiforme G11]